ncbi:MAG: hypothetical protein AB7I50_22680 [Vicinamibacterales bacterium]
MSKPLHGAPKRAATHPGRTTRLVAEWRRQEARETLKEIARQEGLDWLVREVLGMVRTSSS